MASALASNEPPAARPATTAHKLIGTLNILFAGILLLGGVCSIFSLVVQVAMAPLTEGYQKTMQEALQAQQKQEFQRQVDALQAQEDAATDPLEKDRLRSLKISLQQRKRPEVPVADMMAAYRDPLMLGFFATDAVTGLVLNALMFTSGIGLLAARKWSRKLALWVASLKIARLLVLYSFAIAVVIPSFAKQMGQVMEKMVAQSPARPGAPPPVQVTQAVTMGYGIMLSVMALLMILFGIIYPIVSLWVLTRPSVKVACGERLTPVAAEPS